MKGILSDSRNTCQPKPVDRKYVNRMADLQENTMKETFSILRDLQFKRFNVITDRRLRQSRKELSNMTHNSRVKGAHVNNVKELIEFIPVFFKNTINKMNKYQLDFHLQRGSESLGIILEDIKGKGHYQKDSQDQSRSTSVNTARISVTYSKKGSRSGSPLILSSKSSPARSPVPNLQVNSGQNGHQNIALTKRDPKKEQIYTKPFLQPNMEYSLLAYEQFTKLNESRGYMLQSVMKHDMVHEESPISTQKRHLTTTAIGSKESGRNVNLSSQPVKSGKQDRTSKTKTQMNVKKDINANLIVATPTKVIDVKSKRPSSDHEKPISRGKTMLNNQQENKSDEKSNDVMHEESKKRKISTPKSEGKTKTEGMASKDRDADIANLSKKKQSVDTGTNITEKVVLSQGGNDLARNDGATSAKSEKHHGIISDHSEETNKLGHTSNQEKHEIITNDMSDRKESSKEIRRIDVHLPRATSHSPSEGRTETSQIDDPALVTQMSKTFYKSDETSNHVDSHKAGTEKSEKIANIGEFHKGDIELPIKPTSPKRKEGKDKQVKSPSPKQIKEKTNVSTSNGKNNKNDGRPRKSQEDVGEIPRLAKDVKPLGRIETKQLQETITSLMDENQKLKESNDELLKRLSLVASEKLRDGNPNITDLGNNNRPSKLAEKLSELYDNEWTDAYQEISKTVTSEEQRIHVLLETIMISFQNCAKASKDQFETLNKTLRKEMLFLSGSVEDDQIGEDGRAILDSVLFSLRELRQRVAMVSIPKLKQMITTEVGKSFSTKCEPGTKIYLFAERCIELTWLMCIQDPPVYLYRCKPGTPHQDIFRAYKRSGTIVEFCVWPCLYLYEGGPLITKGVAEMKE